MDLLGRLATGLPLVPLLMIIGGVFVLPVLAAVVVYVRHGIAGTDPGPAGQLLLELVALVFRLGRRCNGG